MDNLDKKEKHILLHSLGWSNLRWFDIEKLKEEPYRNHFYTSINNEDYKIIEKLIDKGYMTKSEKSWDGGDSYYFHVTDNAILMLRNYMRAELKKEKPSKSKMRYEIYLKCDVDESFFEWLKNKYWDSYRKRYGCQ